ncbi:MAG: DUF3014 domain-containing protein [Myxococcota bacterium]
MSETPNPTLDAILERRRRQRTIGALIGVGLALAAGGAWLWLRSPAEEIEGMSPPTPPPAAPIPAPAPAAPAPEVAPVPAPAPPPTQPLPPLAESDARVRAWVARVSSRPELLAWMASDELVRRLVAAVDATARGESPVEQAPSAMRPTGRFEVVESGAAWVAAPSTYTRYDLLTDVATSLDVDALLQARSELQPLLDEAHRDLGSPIPSFDAALRQAIVELLSAPKLAGQPLLEPLQPGYGYVDPELESLSDAKKQLLRFGPANTARIQAKLRLLAQRMGIPASELPPTSE